MKKINKIALYGLLVIGGGVVASSCEDFLTITPTNSIVEEEFWQDKNDLNAAVMACYKRMVSDDLLSDYIYWGEERSDNFERSKNTSASGPIANIMNANLLPTYGQFSWTAMYNAINYCNKVLAHGPEVVANDESFSDNDWKPIRAEMITLRALAHFYLVRTFGEVPYVTTDYNNDSQELRLPQSTQLAVLDSIVNDLESVKGEAMVDYGTTSTNKGRVTRKAVYALLADVYLWRASYKAGENQPFTKVTLPSSYAGPLTEAELASRHEEYSTTAADDYQKCIEYCDLVIDMATKEKIEYMNKNGLNVGGGDIDIKLEDLLEANVASERATVTTSSSSAYTSLFGTGNSDESIFELQVDGDTYSNGMITSLFWDVKNSKSGSMTGSVALLENVESNPNVLDQSYIFTKTDYRLWTTARYEDAGQTSFDIGKYTYRSVTQRSGSSTTYLTDNQSSTIKLTTSTRTVNSLDANWIVYRMSEIYLMKAEALSQLYDDEEHLANAFQYVREVFKRSNPYAYRAENTTARNDSLNFSTFSSSAAMEKLVMNERQREFIGEGKRWFDLVRYSLRHGNTADMLKFLVRKYTSSKAVQAKLADMQSLFSPVYNNEIKNNNLLYQNGVWSVNETSSRTDEL